MLVSFHFLIFSIGVGLLVFNQEIGQFLDRNFRNMLGETVGKYVIWLPRLNVVIVGLLFLVGGLLNLADQLK